MITNGKAKIEWKAIVLEARILRSEDGESTEYDRALVELLVGIAPHHVDRDTIAQLLGMNYVPTYAA